MEIKESWERRVGVYVLKLSNKAFYIGMTTNLFKRLSGHIGLRKSTPMWIKMNSPVLELQEFREMEEFRFRPGVLAKREDLVTLEYAAQYGKDYVRGGGYMGNNPSWPKWLDNYKR